MDWGFHGSLLLQILGGIGLAASVGFRAFLPPLVVGLLGRFDVISLRAGLDWMETTPALVVFGTAVVVELLADKIPAVDHALDAAASFVKPAAGALVFAAALTDLPPLWTVVVSLVVGGATAGGVHIAKSGLRLASTGATGGIANPILSIAEDGISLTGSLLSIFVPILLIFLLIVGALVLRRIVRWMRSRSTPDARSSL
jgi:hypothetical protein